MANPLSDRYAEVLLERISSERHPSVTQMNLLESVASDKILVAYILHLVEKIEADPNPSISLMRRVQRLVTSFG